MAGTYKRILILAVIACGIAAFWYFDLASLLSFEELRRRSDDLQTLRADNPLASALLFFGLYVAVTGLSLPGAGREDALFLLRHGRATDQGPRHRVVEGDPFLRREENRQEREGCHHRRESTPEEGSHPNCADHGG